MWLTPNNRSEYIINPYILYHYFQSHAQLITQNEEKNQFYLLNERNEFSFDLANNLIYDHLSFEDVRMLCQINVKMPCLNYILKCVMQTIDYGSTSEVAIEATTFTNILSIYLRCFFLFASFSQ